MVEFNNNLRRFFVTDGKSRALQRSKKSVFNVDRLGSSVICDGTVFICFKTVEC